MSLEPAIEPAPTPAVEPTATPTPPTITATSEIVNDTAKVNIHAPLPGPAPVNMSDLVPAAYKEKAYMQNIDSVDKLFSAFDGLQSKLGQPAAPTPLPDTATDEQKAEFYKSMGRPDEFAKYENTPPPEGVERNEGLSNKFKEIAFNAGLSQAQFTKIQGEYEAALMGDLSAFTDEQNKEFDDLKNKAFGATADQAMAVTKQLIEAHTPDAFKEHMKDLDNKTMIALAGVMNAINDKYIKEDTPTGAPVQTVVDANELRLQAKQLMMTPAYSNSMDPTHDELRLKVTAMYKQASEIGQPKG